MSETEKLVAGSPVTERTISSPAELGNIDYAGNNVHWFSPGQGFENHKLPPSPIDAAAEEMRKTIISKAPEIANQLVRGGLLSSLGASNLIAQADDAKRTHEREKERVKRAAKKAADQGVMQSSVAGQTTPTWTMPVWDDSPKSHQLNLEDLFTTLDFVPLDPQVRMEIYEQNIFQENHISATCLLRLANAVTQRGWEYLRYKKEDLPDADADKADAGEIESLEAWFDNVNAVSDFREIVEHVGAFYQACSNAYIEVIREELGDPAAKPSGLEWAIPSTMRVLRGHRGYVQWLAGQFRYFNVYMASEEDRVDGYKLWQEYWEEKAVDVESDEFSKSPWSRMMNSEMPPGAWNPHLTEIVHIKDISLSSKYYGFPRDYRLGKLNALLQYSVDYNISLQRNNRIPPFIILFHGKIGDTDRADINEYFASIKGADNWGRIPIVEAPPGGGGPQGQAPRAGMEIVKVAGEEKDGIFLELWTRVIKDIAMHYGIPIDLLTTENSNRATVVEASEQFNVNAVGRIHTVIEERLKKITRDDLGFKNRYLHFIDLDADDQLDKANEAKIWHDMGALNPDEIRETYLGRGSRPGGEEYFGVGIVAEDEVGEETSTAAAKDMAKNPKKAAAATKATTAGQQPGSEDDSQDQNTPAKSGVVKQDADDRDILWGYLVAKYGKQDAGAGNWTPRA